MAELNEQKLLFWTPCQARGDENGRNKMKKACFLTGLFLCAFAVSGLASEIDRITLSELHEKADLIVMAGVMQVVEEGNQDQVTIKVELYLKGNSPETVYTFTLVTRGGLKDFDPALKKGDTGVFFLKRGKKKGEVEKAYWGSVAVFPKSNFDLSEEKLGTEASVSMAAWRSYRVKLGEARDIAEYERGFLEGFSGPGKLEKGSADFILGRSDGILAVRGIVPTR